MIIVEFILEGPFPAFTTDYYEGSALTAFACVPVLTAFACVPISFLLRRYAIRDKTDTTIYRHGETKMLKNIEQIRLDTYIKI